LSRRSIEPVVDELGRKSVGSSDTPRDHLSSNEAVDESGIVGKEGERTEGRRKRSAFAHSFLNNFARPLDHPMDEDPRSIDSPSRKSRLKSCELKVGKEKEGSEKKGGERGGQRQFF